MNNKRIAAYDAIKLFAIFLVLWGHCILHLQGYEYDCNDNWLYRLISSFHMPLFMMVCGFFGANVNRLDFKTFFLKKFRTLLMPSMTMGVIFCISWCYIINGGGGELLATYVRCYWFLKSAFICFLLYYAAMHFPKIILGLLFTVLLSQWIYVYKVHAMYPCFLAGVLMKRYSELINQKWLGISMISLFVFFICFYFDDSAMSKWPVLRLHWYFKAPLLLTMKAIGIHLYKVIMGIAGSVAVTTLFIGLERIIPRSKLGNILLSWGGLTLGIYLIQAIVLEHFMMLSLNFAGMNWYLFNFIATPLLSALVLIICVLLIRLIQQSRILRFLLLGEK